MQWRDQAGNCHNLDFVLERGGTEREIGQPKAFVESAWRRYTKHSRNKVQEIQEAILPLAETYSDCHPFLGAVIGGVFTEGSISQLRSLGFKILYIPYESVVDAFSVVGIDARVDEDTPDRLVQRKIRAFERLSRRKRHRIMSTLSERHATDVDEFLVSIRAVLSRQIRHVTILPLHGNPMYALSLTEAIASLEQYSEESGAYPFVRYEIRIDYTNGDEVKGDFHSKEDAIGFLQCVL